MGLAKRLAKGWPIGQPVASPSESSFEQQTEFPNIEITRDIPTSTSDSHNIHRDQGGKGTDSVRGVCPLSSRRDQLVA